MRSFSLQTVIALWVQLALSIPLVEGQSPTVLDMPQPTGWAMTPDNATIIIAFAPKAQLVYLDTVAEKEIKRVTLDFQPTALALQGKKLFAATKGSAIIHVLNAENGEEQKAIQLGGEPVRQLACHPNQGAVFASNSANEIFAIDPESGNVTKTVARGGFLAVDPAEGKVLYAGTQKPIRDQMEVRGGPGGSLRITFDQTGRRATLLKYAVSGHDLELVSGNDNAVINGKAVRVTPDGKDVGVVGPGGWVSKTDRRRHYVVPIYSSDNLTNMRGQVETDASPTDLAFHPVLNLGVADRNTILLFLFNTKSLAEVKSYPVPGGFVGMSDPVLLTFGGRGRKVIYWYPGKGGKGQGLNFFPLELSPKDNSALEKAYGRF